MIDPALFPLFLAGALVLNVTPGPDMAFTLASATRGGTAAGLAAAAGVGAGSLVWAALTFMSVDAVGRLRAGERLQDSDEAVVAATPDLG